MFRSIFGAVTDENIMSVKARWLREEVHGGVEVRVQPDEQDDEQGPQHGGQVHAQEQGKEHALLLWPDGEPQKEELEHISLVIPPPAPLLSAGEGGEWDMSETLKL